MSYGNGGTSTGGYVPPSYPNPGYVPALGNQVIEKPAESASKIRNAVSMTEEQLKRLHESIGTLEARLDSVLTPVGPSQSTPPTNAPTPQQVMSHFLGRIGDVNAALEVAIAWVNTIRERVEV